MDRVRRPDVEALARFDGRPCVSLFLPMHPGGREGIEDDVRLRNAADQAQTRLVDMGMRDLQARELLADIRALPGDDVAWQQRGKSLSIFVAPGLMRVFKGNGHIEEGVFVDEHFHLRPLLPAVSDDDRFFLLALSRGTARLFEGNAVGLTEIPLPELPDRSAIAHTAEMQRAAQVPAGKRGEVRATSGPAAGGRIETLSQEHEPYFRQVAHAIDRRLHGEKTPLILATDVSNVPLWMELSQYGYTSDQVVSGNPDYASPSELHARAWPLIQPALHADRRLALRKLDEADGTRASHGLHFVVPAAFRGRIDSLFIDCTRPWWGRYDAENETIDVHRNPEPGDADLVELAAGATLRHGGRVYAIRPEHANPDAAAQALLRY